MSRENETKKEKGWKAIINHLEKNRLSIKNIIISSKDIKDITKEEPRILCKFDEYKNYPQILKDRNLFVLPTKNRFYQIIEGTGFHFIETLPEVETVEYISKMMFELETSEHGTSESLFLDKAINSGLIEEFVQTSPLYLTIRGRKYSPHFRMKFNETELDVESVQIEVDAGFEGRDVIVLIEAKGEKPESFNIRQLYYPFRMWSTLVPDKNIINIFFWHEKDNDTYHFCQFDFKDEYDYNSIELEKYNVYNIKQLEIKRAKELTSKMIPQADDMNKVIQLVSEVSKGFDNSSQVADKLEFTPRQSSYYRQAAEILQLVKLDHENKYVLTEYGLKLIKTSENDRSELIKDQVINIPIVSKILKKILSKKDHKISVKELIPFVMGQTGLSENTARRRIITLKSWFKWLDRGTEFVEVSKEYLRIRTDKIKKLTDFI